MAMDLKALQTKYHNKVVRVKSLYTFADIDYVVSAVCDLDDGFVFAIRDVNYSIETKRWYSIFCDTLDELAETASHFEVIDD